MQAFVNQVVVPGVVTGCIYALVATVFNVVEKTSRVLSFAHGSIIMWAPLGALIALEHWSIPRLPALLVGAGIALAFALLTERIAIRPFLDDNSALAWILATLGASLILGQIAVIPFHGEAQAFPMALSRRPIDFGILAISPQGLSLVGFAVASFLIIAAFYRFTLTGQMLLAVAEDLDGARMLGISPKRMSQLAAAISAIVASITGFLVAPLLLVSPTLGVQLLFVGFVAAAIGGLGSLSGGLVGGIVTGVTVKLTGYWVGSVWTNTALFGVLSVILLIRPVGLFGKAPARRV